MKFSNKQKREMVKKDYDAIADTYNNFEDHCKVYEYIEQFLNSLNGNNILDVGCGTGKFSGYFYSKGYNVTAIDFSEEMLKIAKQNYPKINFLRKDICNYKSNKKFDGIFAKYVLFHLPPEDLMKVLNNFYKMLNEHGQICVILDIPKVAGEQIVEEEFDKQQKVYFNYFTPDEMVELLQKSNFKVKEKIQIIEEEIVATYSYGLVIIFAEK